MFRQRAFRFDVRTRSRISDVKNILKPVHKVSAVDRKGFSEYDRCRRIDVLSPTKEVASERNHLNVFPPTFLPAESLLSIPSENV